jgi:mRNA-degrading endonuclease RelE of RelBE toxin-antitoxin system
LDRLPPRIARAVAEYVTGVLPQNPHRLSKPCTGQLAGLRSSRRGDYRVLFDLDEPGHVIVLLRVAHRAHAYRPE